MPSHMGVQRIATARNIQVECFVNFILDKFGSALKLKNILTTFQLESQKLYESSIASDIWDHVVIAHRPSGHNFELWCQTTCYKGNDTGKPEPNKTYEVRETLVEGISLRRLFDNNNKTDYRTMHFTVGDPTYTYKWFLDLKAATFDKSIYIGQKDFDIFSAIDASLNKAITDDAKASALERDITNNTRLGLLINITIDELLRWWESESHPKSIMADMQWKLVKNEIATTSGYWPNLSSITGVDIKGRTNSFLFKEDQNDIDPLIARTAGIILKNNPFLSTAIQVSTNWLVFVKQITDLARKPLSLSDYLTELWNMQGSLHLVTRRLLLRIHTEESVEYVQDINVKGVTEHNLYSGLHSPSQVKSICSYIENKLILAEIYNSKDLIEVIHKRGKQIVNQARWFEAKNGTELKPSFDYVQLALKDAGYFTVSPSEIHLKATGYHSEISSERVRPYTNLKVVLSSKRKPICIIKAKYFREQEFARRCKEEAFVGLTLKYAYDGNVFTERFDIPLVMFIDMAETCKPPNYAIQRLISFGWKAVFSIPELIGFIENRQNSIGT